MSRLVVEVRAALDRERLRHVDLDIPDVPPVPERLDHPVGEPERQDVVDRFLAQEVVDTEDLRLVEDGVQFRVQVLRRRQVGAERLLADDAGALRQAHRADFRDHGLGRAGRDREVEQPARCAADLLFRGGHRERQRLGVAGVRAAEGEVGGERVPGGSLWLAGAELLGHLPRVRAERLVGQRRTGRGRPDDPVPLRHQPGHGQVEQPGQDLALGQVAGGPEQHDDVVVRPRPPVQAWLRHRFSPPSSPCGRRTRTAWRTAPCRRTSRRRGTRTARRGPP